MDTKFLKNTVAALMVGCGLFAMTSCSDSTMDKVNTDTTKTASIDPNAQLTTCLLQTYGDFGLMDTYRSYITGFTQHFAGGWNVTNYAGSVHYNDDQARLIWDQFARRYCTLCQQTQSERSSAHSPCLSDVGTY